MYVLAEVEKRDGHPEKGAALAVAFDAAHPESRDVLTGKIDAAIESDPAAAKPLVATALEKYPNDGWLHFQAGRVAQKGGDEAGAAAEYRRAAKLAPDNATVQGWTARYLYKVMNQPDEALERYLDAYFLNPHFYETEYAESRIRNIASARAAAKLAGLDQSALIPSLRDSDPVVAGLAVEALENAWTPEAAKPVAALLRHDDPVIRALAADLLGKKVDATFDDTLTQLLVDSDARVRGFAAYLAVQRWGKKGIEAIKPWLDSPYELIRFDAMSALLEHGGKEGKEIVKAYLKSGKEKSAAMRDIFTRATSS